MASASDAVLLDTGVLVALLDEADTMHMAAAEWLSSCAARLHTIEAVLTETSFFLPPHRRSVLAEFVLMGKPVIHHPDAAGYRRIAKILDKYADLRPDWADAVLVWAAEETGIHRIATLDVRDFTAYRIHGRTRFQLEPIA
jgi:uncharacterized protein